MKLIIKSPSGAETIKFFFGPQPELPKAGNEIVTKTFKALFQRKSIISDMAVEVGVVTGPLTQYALIGCHFEGNSSDYLKISVGMGEQSYTKYNSEIAPKSDFISAGILSYYADSIISQVSAMCADMQIPSGNLDINAGANSIVGSSNHIFSRSTRILCYCLFNQIGGRDRTIFDL